MSISLDVQSLIWNFVSFVGDEDDDEDEDEDKNENENEDHDKNGDGYGYGYGIPFEIFFHTDDVAADIEPFSAHLDESEILTAISTVFCIEKIYEYRVSHELSVFHIYHHISKVHISS
jgi:hypothetical protein